MCKVVVAPVLEWLDGTLAAAMAVGPRSLALARPTCWRQRLSLRMDGLLLLLNSKTKVITFASIERTQFTNNSYTYILRSFLCLERWRVWVWCDSVPHGSHPPSARSPWGHEWICALAQESLLVLDPFSRQLNVSNFANLQSWDHCFPFCSPEDTQELVKTFLDFYKTSLIGPDWGEQVQFYPDPEGTGYRLSFSMMPQNLTREKDCLMNIWIE